MNLRYRVREWFEDTWLSLEDAVLSSLSKILPKYQVDPETCDHDWTVYSTAINQICLELICENCLSAGIVDDPTKQEWCEASTAPSKPYHWDDPTRVIRGAQFKV